MNSPFLCGFRKPSITVMSTTNPQEPFRHARPSIYSMAGNGLATRAEARQLHKLLPQPWGVFPRRAAAGRVDLGNLHGITAEQAARAVIGKAAKIGEMINP